MKIKISLVVPTYNDEKTIIDQLISCEKILKNLSEKYEIIVADDKSKDRTLELLNNNFSKNNHFKIIANENNLGITKNVYKLYMLAKMDFILFYSADGDWNPNDIGNLIDTQAKTSADIVIGKRKSKIGYTPYRKFISSMHHLLPIIFFGVDTIDPGGIKLIKRKLAHTRLISKSQFFEAEIIIRARKKKYKISYFPVTYKKPKTGAGHGGSFNSAIESFIDVIRLRIYL